MKSAGLIAACALLLPFLAVAQSSAPIPTPKPGTPKTDFSGRWRMVKDKSDFAHAHMPDMIVRVIDQHGIVMNVHTIQTTGTKTSSADVTYFTDGGETKNFINGHDAFSKAFWDGPALMIRTTLKLSNGDGEVVEDRWELSEDRQTLTTTSHISTAKGGTDLKLVCVREQPGS